MRAGLSFILTIYMVRQYIGWLLVTLFGLLAFVMLLDAIELARRLAKLEQDVANSEMVIALLMRLPPMVEILLPFSVLFGSMLCFASWSKSHEFVAARSFGQTVWQALTPAFVGVAVVSFLYLTCINPISAATQRQYNLWVEDIFGPTENSRLTIAASGLWLRDQTDGKDIIIHGQNLDPDRLVINRPVIYQLNERGRLEWRMTADALSLQEGKWGFQEAEKIRNDGTVEQLGNITLATKLDERVLLQASAPPDTVSVFGLPGFISMLQQTGLPANAHQVRFHQLLASPFLLLGMIMLAAGFTVVHFSRRQRLRLVLLGLATGFAVYFLSDLVYLLGGSARLPFMIAGWVPALAVFTLGGFMITRVDEI